MDIATTIALVLERLAFSHDPDGYPSAQAVADAYVLALSGGQEQPTDPTDEPLRHEYDPDQPRAEDGRWSKTGTALAGLSKLISVEKVAKVAAGLLHAARHPVSTAPKAKAAALDKLRAIRERYGAAGAAAIGAAYVAYYAAAGALAPQLFLLPVPVSATLLTLAELVRKAKHALLGAPDEPERHERGEDGLSIDEALAALRELLAAVAEAHGEEAPDLDDELARAVLSELLDGAERYGRDESGPVDTIDRAEEPARHDFDEGQHPRGQPDNAGQFVGKGSAPAGTATGEDDTGTGPSGEEQPRRSRRIDRGPAPKAQRAARRFVNVARRRRVIAAVNREAELSSAIDAVNLEDSEPADVVLAEDAAGKRLTSPQQIRDFLRHREAAVRLLRGKKASAEQREAAERVLSQRCEFFEVKTLLTAEAGTVKMSPAALRRKMGWETKYRAAFKVVVFDDRRGRKHSGHRVHITGDLLPTLKLESMTKVSALADVLTHGKES